MLRYSNPFYSPKITNSQPEYEGDKPIEYNGYLIFERIQDQVFDVVFDGVVIGMRAGINGAKALVNMAILFPMIEESTNSHFMKKYFIETAKSKGFYAVVSFSRPEPSVCAYEVTVYKNGTIIKKWDGGYFIGEQNSANSKDAMMESWDKMLSRV